MSQNDLDTAALIASRICHDLISPIGAINNGLELLGMSGHALDGPEMSLIGDSVASASARIRFFRISFGGSSVQDIGRSEVVSVIDDVMGSGRLSVGWGPSDSQPRNLVKLAFLSILCLETAMPFGGRIEVSCNHKQWKIHGKSEKFNEIDDLWSGITRKQTNPDISSAHIQFALLPMTAEKMNRNISFNQTKSDITILF